MNQTLIRIFAALLLFVAMVPASWAQTATTVSGVVSDETGEPLIGASVTVPGHPGGVTTDIDGNYRIALPQGSNQLTFSYVGYNTKTVTVNGSTLDVQLDPASEALQEMVVIGYGSTKKNDLTGSVSSISEKDFNQGVIS